MEKEIEDFFKWLRESKGITKIDLTEAIDLYFDEFQRTING